MYHSIPFSRASLPTSSDPLLEQLGINLTLGDRQLLIVSDYIPPTSSCPAEYSPSIRHLLDLEGDVLFLGDFNAHDELWNSSRSDPRGNMLAEDIDDSFFGVLNDDSPTRWIAADRPSSPDISLASSSVLPLCSWSALRALSSDHLPIVINVEIPTETAPVMNRSTIFNYDKADWELYTEETKQAFLALNLNVFEDPVKGEKTLRQILLRAGSHCIPAGRRKLCSPALSPEVTDLIAQRDSLRDVDPSSPELPDMNNNIRELVDAVRRKRWEDHVSSFDYRTKPHKLWRTIKALKGQPASPPNVAISFGGTPVHCRKTVANAFTKQFTCVLAHKTDGQTRKVVRKIKSSRHEGPPITFLPREVLKAIKVMNSSKAAGPDELTALHLKHIGSAGVTALTTLLNASLRTTIIPSCLEGEQNHPSPQAGKTI